MKKFSLILSLAAFCTANAVVQNAPSSFSVITYAINNFATSPYSGEPWQHNLSTPVKASNELVESFESNISDNYKNTKFSSRKHHDTEVTKSLFTSKESDNFNFVYVDTHGDVDIIAMHPYGQIVHNYEKPFGGKTYWAMFTACLTFKKREMDPFPWFNGIHSILGYSSSFHPYENETYKVKCGLFNLFKCSRTRHSYYVQRDFAENWIEDKQSIWDSYKNAVYRWMVQDRNYGIEPVIVFLFGSVDGKDFDSSNETFEKSYQKPLYRNSNLKLAYKWCTFGTPEYD